MHLFDLLMLAVAAPAMPTYQPQSTSSTDAEAARAAAASAAVQDSSYGAESTNVGGRAMAYQEQADALKKRNSASSELIAS